MPLLGSSKPLGYTTLVAVAILWASYTPTLKFLLLLKIPPSPAILTAIQSSLSALFLLTAALGTIMEPHHEQDHENKSHSGCSTAPGSHGNTNGHFKPRASNTGLLISSDSAEMQALLHHGGRTRTQALDSHNPDATVSAQQVQPSNAGHLTDAHHRHVNSPTHDLSPHPLLPVMHSTFSAPHCLATAATATAYSPALSTADPHSRSSQPGGIRSKPKRTAPSQIELCCIESGNGHAVSHSTNGTHSSRGTSTNTGSSSSSSPTLLKTWLRWQHSASYMAGVELGLLNFVGNAAAVYGMQRLTATQGAFLSQVTTLLTPVLVYLADDAVHLLIWVACALGMMGSAMVAMGSSTGAGDGSSSHGHHAAHRAHGLMERALQQQGASELLVMPDAEQEFDKAPAEPYLGLMFMAAASLCWALATVRLGYISAGPGFRAIDVSAVAQCVVAGLALVWLVLDLAGHTGSANTELMRLWSLTNDHTSLAVLLWCGLGPGALASYLQAAGQQYVGPAEAQVIYSTTPIWSAIIAGVVLDGEAMGVVAWTGAGVMLVASLLAGLAPSGRS